MEFSDKLTHDVHMAATVDLNGVSIWKELVPRDQQIALVDVLRDVAALAPFRRYTTPGGRKMSVKMSGAGKTAWVSDRSGYLYSPIQPDGGQWPDIPGAVLNVWDSVSGVCHAPDSCLINYYGEGAKMGLHQDRDEVDLSWPVVSISLGDDALFRVGGLHRSDPTSSIWLSSGDVAVLSGQARTAFHGIDRIKFGTSSLRPNGGRINVTLRVAG